MRVLLCELGLHLAHLRADHHGARGLWPQQTVPFGYGSDQQICILLGGRLGENIPGTWFKKNYLKFVKANETNFDIIELQFEKHDGKKQKVLVFNTDLKGSMA